MAQKLFDKIDEKSMVVLGEHDILRQQADATLLDKGFDICDVDYVYVKKPPSDEKDYFSNPDFMKNTFINKK